MLRAPGRIAFAIVCANGANGAKRSRVVLAGAVVSPRGASVPGGPSSPVAAAEAVRRRGLAGDAGQRTGRARRKALADRAAVGPFQAGRILGDRANRRAMTRRCQCSDEDCGDHEGCRAPCGERAARGARCGRRGVGCRHGRSVGAGCAPLSTRVGSGASANARERRADRPRVTRDPCGGPEASRVEGTKRPAGSGAGHACLPNPLWRTRRRRLDGLPARPSKIRPPVRIAARARGGGASG